MLISFNEINSSLQTLIKVILLHIVFNFFSTTTDQIHTNSNLKQKQTNNSIHDVKLICLKLTFVHKE